MCITVSVGVVGRGNLCRGDSWVWGGVLRREAVPPPPPECNTVFIPCHANRPSILFIPPPNQSLALPRAGCTNYTVVNSQHVAQGLTGSSVLFLSSSQLQPGAPLVVAVTTRNAAMASSYLVSATTSDFIEQLYEGEGWGAR
jgi:hypothetical protein